MDHVLPFLKKLKKNNNKLWMDANRNAYLQAKEEMESFVDGLISAYGKKDPSIAHLSAKDCLFRINRDIRFSKDKSPYKTNFGASISAGGKKSPLAGYYLHIEPGQNFVGGGLWMPEPANLARLRQEIDYNGAEFAALLKAPAFKKLYGALYTGEDASLSRVPKGYAADHPSASFLKLKSFIAMHQLIDKDISDSGLVKKCTDAFTALRPLVEFINKAITD